MVTSACNLLDKMVMKQKSSGCSLSLYPQPTKEYKSPRLLADVACSCGRT